MCSYVLVVVAVHIIHDVSIYYIHVAHKSMSRMKIPIIQAQSLLAEVVESESGYTRD